MRQSAAIVDDAARLGPRGVCAGWWQHGVSGRSAGPEAASSSAATLGTAVRGSGLADAARPGFPGLIGEEVQL